MAIYIGNHNLRFTVDVTEETEKDFWEKTEDEGAKNNNKKKKQKEREIHLFYPPLCFLFFSSFSFSSLIKMHKYFFQ